MAKTRRISIVDGGGWQSRKRIVETSIVVDSKARRGRDASSRCDREEAIRAHEMCATHTSPDETRLGQQK